MNKKDVPSWLTNIDKNLLSVLTAVDFKRILPGDVVHQGIAMKIAEQTYCDISDLASCDQNCVVAILDGITDPHNVGAIIRTAAAFKVHCLILAEKSSCKITGAVAKAASGGLENTSICVVKNLSQAIGILKSYGFWIVSLCEKGDTFFHELDLKGKTCLVFGSENDGIRRLQKENSDFIAKLPTNPNFPVLNVSASAAIAFYEVSRQNNSVGKR
ncbi:MAG: RNA methyltransferase [Holosporales bacterium]|nr:RNA methyltransferase [Holosporales bacterium]